MPSWRWSIWKAGTLCGLFALVDVGFFYANLRMGSGRSADVHKAVGDSLLHVLKQHLDALLQRFTEAHPDVVNTRRMIRELEDQRRLEALNDE